MKIAIIGAGNIGGAIARGLSQGSIFQPSDIICTAHEQKFLDRLHEENPDLQLTLNNKEAVQQAEVILLAVKPWLVETVIQDIKPVLDYSRQIIISVAAGVTIQELFGYLRKNDKYVAPTIFRAMPNTGIAVRSSMSFLCASSATQEQTDLILSIFSELGNAMLIEERFMNAGMALASCGIAYAMRYIRASIEGGVEMGFYPQQAQEIVLHTVKGAVDLLMAHGTNPEEEIDKVTTPGGVTIKGLNEMELAGFTSAVIRGLKKGI